MADADKIKGIVNGLLAERFEGAHIESVSVSEEKDDDGDSFLRVVVVYDPNVKALDGAKLSGFVRSLRPALDKKGETRFPVMSFLSRNDYEALAGAA